MPTQENILLYSDCSVATDKHGYIYRADIPLKKIKGFTLVELLIVMAIVGIVASVAAPSYQQHITKERRADAHNLLMLNTARLTKCFTLAGSYENGCDLLDTSKQEYYSLTSELTATTWKLTAIPVSDNVQSNDTECLTIAIDHIGVKSATGDSADSCWD